MIENFFDKLQDKFNVNTVPTVVKLTNKLQKAVNLAGETAYPFCPMCMGVRDKVGNLLEMGSTIKRIGEGGVLDSITCPEDWLEGASPQLAQALCYGCKRIFISVGTLEKRALFASILPQIVA